MMVRTSRIAAAIVVAACPLPLPAQTLVATEGVQPNRAGHMDRPVRYRPDGDAFVIDNGTERFNRPLYGGNTAFRVDGGDLPEFVLYLPGRGGNLRFAVRGRDGSIWWLHDARSITTRYQPGELEYRIADPRLDGGTITLTVVALAAAEGLAVRATGTGIAPGTALRWAFGGVNGQRGKRDGDIGTEKVPIAEWFGFRAAFADRNTIDVTARDRFAIAGPPGTITGTVHHGEARGIADGGAWDDPARLFAARPDSAAPARPVMTGTLDLTEADAHLLLQRTAYARAAEGDLATYQAVSAGRRPAAPRPPLAAPYPAGSLGAVFDAARAHFARLRGRVRIVTPDPWLDAAVGALNIGADAVWDDPQGGIMHGAVAWRTMLLGWRGPYALDALGWHDRARANFRAWLPRQNVRPVPAALPPADADSNLSRSEAALHSNGDLSNSHYDMNTVFVDALFRHLAWTGDVAFAREAWPAIERHLAWQRRLFRRPFGRDGLPLYEAYAQIWASDDIHYAGGGVAYASAYNLFHHRQAARLARLLGHDPAPDEREAAAIGRAMRAELWLTDAGCFAEYRDWLGERRAHPHAGLWSFYHVVDSDVPTAHEAWRMADGIQRDMPWLPVAGKGVPADRRYGVFASSDWMPYSWSVNNVVMGGNLHTALALWQAGRGEDAFTLTKAALLASMYMGISPGNVGSLNYLDVYRREAQRDFADGAGVMARTIVEGLFGIRPDAFAHRLHLRPGLPAAWDHAALTHPDMAVSYQRDGMRDRWTVSRQGDRFRLLTLQLPAARDRVAAVTVDGRPVRWRVDDGAIGRPAIVIDAPLGARTEIVVAWAGRRIAPATAGGTRLVAKRQGQMQWYAPVGPLFAPMATPVVVDRAPVGPQRAIDLSSAFNDRIDAIFAPGRYRSPRSPFVSLALPTQGLGAWAGHVNATAAIDDRGLRRAAAGDGWFHLPDGGRFRTPAAGRNAVFVSKWDHHADAVTVPVAGRGRFVRLLMTGTTNPMQSRIDNGEVVVTYADGGTARLALHNPTTWWPIERDYLIDDYQFRVPGPRPLRVDLATARVRPGGGGEGAEQRVEGGAATVLGLAIDPRRPLRSLTVRARANDVVIGLLAATVEEAAP